MATQVKERAQKYRNNLRTAGLRPVQIWVPDTRHAGFNQKCHQQALLVAKADQHDTDLSSMLDTALSDIEGWKL